MGEQTRAAGIQKLQAHLKNRNTIIHPVWSVGHLDCKDNGFLVFPDLTPSHDKQRSPILSHGSMTGLREAPCSPNKWPQLSKTQPDPFLPELSRSSALAAALCFCFTLKKKKKENCKVISQNLEIELESTPNSLLLHSKSPCPKPLRENATYYTLSDASLS